jgi:hypothetical protein
MTEHIDRDAGFATFRRGRSLCVRLQGRLDPPMARGVAAQIRTDREATRLRLECSTLDDVDPVAARILAASLLTWSQRRTDRSVDVLNLGLEIQRHIAWHPLRALTDPDELVFIDPDREAAWGKAPSRH